jgi:hypothetical protein
MFMTTDYADNADKTIREIRVIRGQRVEGIRRGLRALIRG